MKGRSWYQEEEIAQSYEDERFSGRGGAIINRREKEAITDILGDLSGKRVLEVATGTGRFAEMFQNLGAEVVGVDISKEMMGQGFGRIGGHFVRADASNLPFRDDEFDVVVSIRFLHLLPEPETFVSEMKRVSKDTVLFDTFNAMSGRSLYNTLLPMGSRLYTEDEVRELTSAVGLRRVRRRDEFVLPFGTYRFAPDFMADAMESIDEALISLGPGKALSSVTYWKSSVR